MHTIPDSQPSENEEVEGVKTEAEVSSKKDAKEPKEPDQPRASKGVEGPRGHQEPKADAGVKTRTTLQHTGEELFSSVDSETLNFYCAEDSSVNDMSMLAADEK